MKVHVDPERCQGHTLCAMIAPDVFQLDEVDGHSTAVIDGEVPGGPGGQGGRGGPLVPRTGHHDLRARDKEAEHGARDPTTERKKNRYHFDRHTPEYREQFETITTEMVGKCPVAWSDTYGGHWVAAGHHEVYALSKPTQTAPLPNDRVYCALASRQSRMTLPALPVRMTANACSCSRQEK